MKRRLPDPRAFAPLIRLRPPRINTRSHRLDSALTIWDLREIAKRRTPKGPFDYTDGAAEGEISLARARQAFEDIEFNPRILRDVSEVDTSSIVLGDTVALPFGIAPTGFTRMMHAEGEVAGASAAGAAGIPFALSTLGTTSIEGVKSSNPNGRNWFQLYMWKDRNRSLDLIKRAATAGSTRSLSRSTFQLRAPDCETFAMASRCHPSSRSRQSSTRCPSWSGASIFSRPNRWSSPR